METIGFGGGCHWCTEAVFQVLRGIDNVEQGFISSAPPNHALSEAVLVTFDPIQISLSVLTDIHLRTHASGSNHSMRGKYRSAIYVFDVAQRARTEKVLQELQCEFEEPRVTKVLDFAKFKPSEPRFQNYYATDEERPFCKTYIDPKLAYVRKMYGRDVYKD